MKETWKIISIISLVGYFLFLAKGDIYNANLLLLLSLTSDNKASILEISERKN